jgi:F-type H+-transporting ATPase subunit gamma
MASNKEILDRMNGIKDTLKITNAMYLISSSKLKKARKNWQSVTDYFQTIQATIGDILSRISDMEHIYLEPVGGKDNKYSKRAYIVVTADKGLAGAYNLNVIKLAEQELQKHKDAKLFVVGQIGRHYFEDRNIEIEADFIYSSQNPSMQRARNITIDILDYFHAGKIDEVYIIFTEMKNSVQSETIMMKLLPLSREWLKDDDGDTSTINSDVSFFPDEKSVFNSLAPITMHGIIFSALTESYCAELNDRMTAMDGASKSAKEMLDDLALQYNRSRQYGITQEITEVSAGSKAQKKKKNK